MVRMEGCKRGFVWSPVNGGRGKERLHQVSATKLEIQLGNCHDFGFVYG